MFKSRFEKIIKKLVSPLAGFGVTPNTITILGLIVAVVSAWFYADWDGDRAHLIYGAALLLLSGLLDTVDGVLARNTGNVTRFGGFLDSLLDRYSDIFIISGIIIGKLCSVASGLVAVAGSFMVSYTRSRAEMEGVKMSGVGFFERAERILFLAICSILAYWWLELLYYGVIILALLTHVTLIQRVMYFKKEVEKG